MLLLFGGSMAVRAVAGHERGSATCYGKVPTPSSSDPRGWPTSPSDDELTAVRAWADRNDTWVGGFATWGRDVMVGVTRDPCPARAALRPLVPSGHVVIVRAYHSLAELRPVRRALVPALHGDRGVAALGIDEVIATYDGRLIVSLGAHHPSTTVVKNELAERFTHGDASWFVVAEAGPARQG